MLRQYIMLLAVLVWSGCVVAISFMESWLKFRAPGVTLPIGLSIGRLVFNALNKMERLFAAVVIAGYFLNQAQTNTSGLVLLALAVGLLILETCWLLPALDARANIVISGKSVAASSLHWYFVAAEIIKLGSLLALGFQLFKVFAAR